MFRLTIPVQNTSMTANTREIYLEQFKKAGAHRVFLIVDRCFDVETARLQAERAKVNVEFLKSNGLFVVIWVGSTIGHGALLAHEVNREMPQFVQIVTEHGTPVEGTFCPLDSCFAEKTAKVVAEYAKIGADGIILDDDFRINLHGNGLCCFCDLHMEQYRKILSEPDLTREQMREYALTAKPNRYRNAFLKVNGDALRNLAEKIRDEVDKVDEKTCVSLCTTTCQLGVDGVLATELSKILAGKNPPLLRLGGAPYWAKIWATLPMTIATAQMYAEICKEQGIELIGEGDTYPRPAAVVPASYLEMFDAVIRTNDAFDGILKYMVDYTSSADYETAYLEHHYHDMPALKTVESWFSDSVQSGVRVYEKPDLFADSDFSLSPAPMEQPFPFAASMMYENSIPVKWRGESKCGVLFGENARGFSHDRIGGGLILDGVSAAILTASGVDVGLTDFASFEQHNVDFESFSNPCERIRIHCGNCSLLNANLNPKAVAESFTNDGKVISYRYENADGQKFLVFLFDCYSFDRRSGLLYSYARQNQLISFIESISKESLPAVCRKKLNLITVTAEQDGKLQIGLFNCSEDSVISPKIRLNREYNDLATYRCNGELKKDEISLDGEIPPYSFALLSVK